jgi:putative membrane protein
MIPRLIMLTVAAPVALLAHERGALQPGGLWRAWEFDPGVVIPLLISAILYARGSQRHFGLTALQKTCFWTGWLTLMVALLSPLHPLGEELFCAHMVQHEILMLISAPLFVLSRPLVTYLWAMPIEWRRTLGRWSKTRAVSNSWKFFTDPLSAWWIHAVVIWLWHAPPLFEATLKSDVAHTMQHLSFFLSALLFWWSLLYARGRKAYGLGVLYLFTTAVHTSILGALLTFSPHIWYSSYQITTQVWGFTPLQDQQLGGLVMWIPASLVYLGAGLVLFAAWMKESDALLERASGAK